jgi:hypothetical protein
MYYSRFKLNSTKFFKWIKFEAIYLDPSSPIEFKLK